MIKVITDGVTCFGIDADYSKAKEALSSLKEGVCKGNEFRGWLDLPD